MIKGRGLDPARLANLVMIFNAGMLCGSLSCGALSERVGRRLAIALYAGCTLLAAPLYLFSSAPAAVALGAFLGGFVGVGWTGATPSYLSEHFPTRLRGLGVGTAYHIGALVGALAPVVIPALHRSGMGLDPRDVDLRVGRGRAGRDRRLAEPRAPRRPPVTGPAASRRPLFRRDGCG